MPHPGANETEQEFVSRCMAHPHMQKYDKEQRTAVCFSMFEDRKKGLEMGPEDADEYVLLKGLAEIAGVDFPPSVAGLSKVWSDAARAAALEARRGGSKTTSGKVQGLVVSKPTKDQKERYVFVKQMGDTLTQFAVHNRRVGVAEGKTRAWEKRAVGFPQDSKQARRSLHISQSYRAKATQEADIRDALRGRIRYEGVAQPSPATISASVGVCEAFLVKTVAEDIDAQVLIDLLESGGLDDAIGEELDTVVGLTEEDIEMFGSDASSEAKESD